MRRTSVANLFFKNGPNPASFCLFSFFSNDKYSTNTINEKSIDGVLGIRIRGGRMVGADESTELWRHPFSGKSYKRATFIIYDSKSYPNNYGHYR